MRCVSVVIVFKLMVDGKNVDLLSHSLQGVNVFESLVAAFKGAPPQPCFD